MNDEDYNYSHFVMSKEAPALLKFPEHSLRVGQRAPEVGRKLVMEDAVDLVLLVPG